MNVAEQILDGLNPEQREVALHDKGPLLVVAVAGSGKTQALIRRIAYLVRVRGVDPERILAVTFSRNGATEMQERLDHTIGPSGARIGTFHSVALEILRAEVPDYKNWQIDDTNRYRIVLKDTTGFRAMNWVDADVTHLERVIGLCKANLATPDSDVAAAIAKTLYEDDPRPGTNPRRVLEAYSRAEELRRERLLLTFDDMMMVGVGLLRDDDGVRARWASRYDYVLQDEAQDQSLSQLIMGELLAQDHKNYMLVGDPGQAIFSWRGAKPEKLLAFESTWNARVIRMGRNYRCGQSIVDASNLSLSAMPPETHLGVEMLCERGVPGEIVCREFLDLDHEAVGLVESIQERIADGERPGDIAVLYRVNSQSRAPEEALITAGIPYRILGSINFYERKEVKDLLAYLRLANGSGDVEDVSRCINSPFRFLGKAFVDRVRDEVRKSGGQDYLAIVESVSRQTGIQRRQRDSAEDWANIIHEMRDRIADGHGAPIDSDLFRLAKPARILEDILRYTRYIDSLVKNEGDESTENSRVSNVREMIRAAERFSSVGDLLDYVDRTIAASKKQASEKNPNKITLCTGYRAKGLEWPTVYVIGVSQGVLPHWRSEDLSEERRLFYVAITRARDFLHLSCVRVIAMGAKISNVQPSPFLHEIGLRPDPTPRQALSPARALSATQ